MLPQPDRPPPSGPPVASILEHPAPFRVDRPPPPPPSPFAPAFKPIDGLARAVRVLIATSIAVTVVDALLEAYLIRMLDRSPLFGGLPAEAVRVYDVTVVLLLIDVILVLAAGVCVMVLFKRMMENGAILAPGRATYKSHWAVTGWLVPFLSLIRPFQVVRQIWQTSVSGDADANRRGLPSVSRIWWGLFLVSNSVWFAGPSVPVDGSATADDFAAEAVGQLIQSLFQAASGAAFLVLLASLIPRHRLAITSS